MNETIKFMVLKDVEPTKVEARLITPGMVWISKDPYHLWNESKDYECENLYGPIAEYLRVIVTSEWWPYDEGANDLTAKDTSGYPVGEYPNGYWAYCINLDKDPISPDALIFGWEVWMESCLDRMQYIEGTYDHYLFQLGSSFLYKGTSGSKGTKYCPTHTSYYRWCQVNGFAYDPSKG